jgi:hypothetical protein
MANLPRVVFSAAVNYADATAPTLVSAEVQINGTDFEIVLSEPVAIGAGGNGGFTVTASGGAVTLAYASGSGTDTLVYTLSRTVNSGETFSDFDYTQPGNGVEDLAGNDLATFTNQHAEITNSSTQSGFSYLFTENLEGAFSDSQSNPGYDNAGAVASSTSIDAQYATSPAPLEGSYSLYPASFSRTVQFPISGNPRSFCQLVRPVTSTGATAYRFLNGSTTVAIVERTAGNKLIPWQGSVAGAATVDSFSTGTTWYLWCDYVPSTGGNGVFRVGFSSTGTKPTSGNAWSQVTTGDATLEIDTWQVGGLGANVIHDRFRASASEIGSNPT